MRIPFLRPKASPVPPPARARQAKQAATPTDVQAARIQARRRLLGALVLLLIGVVGFPVLFETQPRPLPMDTPIELPRRDTVVTGLTGKDVAAPKPQPLPALPPDADAETLPPSVVAAPSSSGTSNPPPVAPPSSSPKVLAAAASVPAVPAVDVSRGAVPIKAAAEAPAKPAQSQSASSSTAGALNAGAPNAGAAAAGAVASSPPSESGRFVVQAGAYSEAGKLHEARAKLEKLGLKTYTQVVESDKGPRTRLRVGPYATRAEAEAIVARVRNSGLPAALLAL